MMMILPLRYTHIGRCFRVVAEYTLNPPTRGLNTSDHLSRSGAFVIIHCLLTHRI